MRSIYTSAIYLLAIFCLVSLSFGASTYGNLGLGAVNTPYSTSGIGKGKSGLASVDKKSFSYYNSANMAFNEYTIFDVTFGLNSTLILANQDRGVQNDFTLKNIQMSIPLGFAGNISGAFYQQTQSNLTTMVSNGDIEGELTIEGGVSELVPGYAYKIGDNLALGVNFHLVSGQQRWMLDQNVVSNSGDPRDSLIAGQARYISEFDVLNSGSYTGLSLQYHDKLWDVGAFFHTSGTIERTFNVNQFFQQDSTNDSRGIPTFFTNTQVVEADIPWKLGLGLSFEPFVGHEFSSDYVYTAEGDPYESNPYLSTPLVRSDASHQWGLGYERKGSGRGYDSYLNKTVLRAGYFGNTFASNDQIENGVTVGLGLPLGRRGAMIDIAYGYTNRQGSQSAIPDEHEQFIYFSFTGLGQWGEPSRRYR